MSVATENEMRGMQQISDIKSAIKKSDQQQDIGHRQAIATEVKKQVAR